VALITVEDLCFRFPRAEAPILDGVNVSFEEGDRVAILAGNAGGKTTLARWVAGLLPEGVMKAERGQVSMEGKPFEQWSQLDRAAAIQFVGQVPSQQMTGCAFTVYEEIAFGPCNLALAEAEVRRRVDQALTVCNLSHLAKRDPFTLSGGEQQRLSIASALAMQPRVLILDEPTSNLDPESRDAFIEQLEALPTALTVIVFEVALRPSLALARRFMLLDGGRVVVDGSPEDVLAHPRCIEVLGMTSVTEAAYEIDRLGRWPPGLPLPLTLAGAVPSFEAARAYR
jgi:energy-coupling factor transporter ATP-binding protein EcfA2